MRPDALSGGFANPSLQSAHAFRALLEAMARPGTIHAVTGARPPPPLSTAAGVALLTLADPTTPVHLAGAAGCTAVADWLRFHVGAPLVEAEAAMLAVGTWASLRPLARFPIGEIDYPDRSATLIIEMDHLEPEGPLLRGPGIRNSTQLSLPEVTTFRANRAMFPLGLDFILACGDRLAALPRSTIVEDC